jgi:hypothetical protein
MRFRRRLSFGGYALAVDFSALDPLFRLHYIAFSLIAWDQTLHRMNAESFEKLKTGNCIVNVCEPVPNTAPRSIYM